MHIASTEKHLCPANAPTPAQFYIQAPNSTKSMRVCRYRRGRLVLSAASLDFAVVGVSLTREEFTLKTGCVPRASPTPGGLSPQPTQQTRRSYRAYAVIADPGLSLRGVLEADGLPKGRRAGAIAQHDHGHQPSPAATPASPGSDPGRIGPSPPQSFPSQSTAGSTIIGPKLSRIK